MDFSGIEHFIPNIAKWLNVEPATVVFLLFVATGIANIAGRLIPDDKVGPLGVIRNLAKMLGGYASNRVTTNLNTNQIVQHMVGELGDKEKSAEIDEKASDSEALIPAVVEEITPMTPKPKPPFPGATKDV